MDRDFGNPRNQWIKGLDSDAVLTNSDAHDNTPV